MTNNEEQPQEVRKTFIQIFVEEVSASPLTITILAIFSALIVGGLIVALTSEDVYAAWAVSPLEAIKTGAQAAWTTCPPIG